MTLLFCDSFDHYTTVTQKWDSVGSGGAAISSGNGRNGTSSGRATNLDGGFRSNSVGAKSTLILGVAFRYPAGYSSSEFVLLSFRDGASAQCDLRLTPARTLKITRAGTALGTGSAVLSPDVFYYIEFKVTFHGSTGVAHVRVNGVTDQSLTSQNTQATANPSADSFTLMTITGGGAGNTDFDDLYVCDALGSTNNDFLGDVRVQAILPNGNGNSSQLVGSDANSTDNYLLVDEAAPATADYVESSTVGDKDTYAFGDLTPTTGTVYGVQVLPYAAKTDAGVRSIASVARLSGTEVDSADKVLSTSYQYLPDIRETKPGGGAWTISDVNSAEFGVKIVL